MRQITTGSLTGMLQFATLLIIANLRPEGLFCGLAIGVFSKPLALLIGLVIAGLYVCDNFYNGRKLNI
jgi:hypothetical protein